MSATGFKHRRHNRTNAAVARAARRHAPLAAASHARWRLGGDGKAMTNAHTPKDKGTRNLQDSRKESFAFKNDANMKRPPHMRKRHCLPWAYS